VLLTFSDPSSEPIAQAHTQGAAGAYRHECKGVIGTH
jgi:hypothetical protein